MTAGNDFRVIFGAGPLQGRRGEFLQVLLPVFRLRKTGRGSGIRLMVELTDHLPSIVDVAGKRKFNRIVRRPRPRESEGLARHIAEFTRDSSERERLFDCSRYPLRYANGGVLPVVRLKGREYFWLFYRDIFPVGWNIANGGSNNIEEMLDPDRIVAREFAEEAIVVDFTAERVYTHRHWRGATAKGVQEAALRAWSERLGRNLLEFERVPLAVEWLDGPDSADIAAGRRHRRTKGYFLNITPVDNGIELDRIALIRLDQGVTLLDGELRNGRLVNQIVGLFDAKKMRGHARIEVIPDAVFFGGRERILRAKTRARRIKELGDIVAEYLENPALERSDSERRAFRESAAPYSLCPAARLMVERYLDWATTKGGHGKRAASRSGPRGARRR